MEVEVQGLTKRYGAQRAIDGVSFALRPGEITGFLGPNGAGKSTTMKILTGYIAADEGAARIGPHDVAVDGIAARRNIGYLPEHNPLYLDMYAHEFLRFAAALYGLRGKTGRARVDAVIEQTGLGPEQHKKLGALSKGFRQRAGLAAALVHDPPVLILDEPTTGLDPIQVLDIRRLIKEVGSTKTVLFSSHILPEVSAVAARALIIHKGTLRADKPMSELAALADPQPVWHTTFVETGDHAAWLAKLPAAGRVERIDDHACLVETGDETAFRNELFAEAAARNLNIAGFARREPTLEEIFRKLTIDAG